MKVKNINSTSQKTEKLIKQSFIELLEEKKEIQYVTVTELVKKAGITRSSFYTHYDNIYDVAASFQSEVMDAIVNKDNEFDTIEDAYKYIDDIILYLKDNEETYRKLLSSTETLIFFEKIRLALIDKICKLLNKNNITSKNIELDVEFLVDGIVLQFVKYFRRSNFYDLDTIGLSIKKWSKKIILDDKKVWENIQ